MQLEQEFYYGRRQLIRYDKTGQPSYTYLPLTLADFLNPQAGDDFAQGAAHQQLVEELCYRLRYHYRYNPAMGVLSQVKMIWPVPGLAQPAPDLAVIPNLSNPERVRPQFDVTTEGTQPTLVLEVTSPRFAQLDLTEKVAIYAQAGVREYFIVAGMNPAGAASAYRLLGYNLVDSAYRPIAPDDQGRLYSTALRIWFAVHEAGNDIELVDKRTGRTIQPDADYRESIAVARAEAANRATHIAAQLDFLRSGP